MHRRTATNSGNDNSLETSAQVGKNFAAYKNVPLYVIIFNNIQIFLQMHARSYGISLVFLMLKENTRQQLNSSPADPRYALPLQTV